MSKITFRADEELVDRVESLDASKSEVMREALRSYLDGEGRKTVDRGLDELVADRVDELIAERTGAGLGAAPARDVNLTVSVEPGTDATARQTDRAPGRPGTEERPRAGDGTEARQTCDQCGEPVSDTHVYCPNCGEKTSNRVFCECGDELRSDWAFCPSCGRRTPSADVLER